jgi:Protein kinase domain
MAEYKDLTILLYDVLKPNVYKDPDCEELLKSNAPLGLNRLFDLARKEGVSDNAKKYLYALIVTRAQELSPVRFEMTKDVVEIFLKLSEILQVNYNEYSSNLKGLLRSEILECKDIKEIFDWGGLIIELASRGVSSSEILSILDIAYSSLIFDLPSRIRLRDDPQPRFSKDEIIEYLRYLIKAEILGLDSTGALEVIVGNAITWVEENNDFYSIEKIQGSPINQDLAGTKRILGLLNLIKKPEDKVINEKINKLKQEYGFDIIDFQYDDEEYNLDLKTYKEGDEIKDINQLLIEKDPIVTHPNSDKTIFTYIYKARIKKYSTVVAVKKIVVSSEGDINEFKKCMQEANIMRALSGKHKTFLKFYGDFKVNNEYYMVMELGKWTLTDLLASNEKLTEIKMLGIVKNLLDGFCILSEKRIYHRDIKPQNILITEDLTPKIIDFGITLFNEDLDKPSLRITNITNTKFVQGTAGYMSPEQKRAHTSYRLDKTKSIEKYNLLKSDVYSLGITFFVMCTGEDPTKYEDPQNYQLLQNKIANIGGRMKPLISNMVNEDPNKRLTFAELLSFVSNQTSTIAS